MTKDITLYLPDSHRAAPVESGSQLYTAQLGEVALAIKEALKQADLAKEAFKESIPGDARPLDDRPWLNQRMHQNLGILGQRGAGKTSFLLSVLQLLDQSQSRARDRFDEQWKKVDKPGWQKDPGVWHELSKAVLVAGLIEPSRMEKNDHLVVSVFGTLLEVARTYLVETPPRSRDKAAQADALLRQAEEITQHIPALIVENRLAKAYHEHEIEGLYDEIVKARSGFNLERAFWKFMDEFLALMDKKMIVVGLDDVDLAYEQGEAVLESLRRYLTSSRLLFLVSGDLAMFRRVLHTGHLTRLRASAPNESTTPGVLEDTASDLVEHYLKKVLPHAMRVHLPPVSEALARRVEFALEPRKPDGDPPPTVAFLDEHFYNHLRLCLFHPLMYHDRLRSEVPEPLLKDFEFLIPTDIRHFLELCALESPFDAFSRSAGVGTVVGRWVDHSMGIVSFKRLSGDLASKGDYFASVKNVDRINRKQQEADFREWAVKQDPSLKDPFLNAIDFRWEVDPCQQGGTRQVLQSPPGPKPSGSYTRGDMAAAQQKVLLGLARVYQGTLEKYDLEPNQLVEWQGHSRIGLLILNNLFQNSRIRDEDLFLDTRTGDRERNVVLALLRLSIEGYLYRRRYTRLLCIALDLLIPAYLLLHQATDGDRERLRHQFGLHLMDSRRRHYYRIVSWMMKGTTTARGVLELCGRPGAMEKLLDINCDSPSADWRRVVRNPDVRTKEYLKGAARPETEFEVIGGIPGYQWATRYLRDLLNAPGVRLALKDSKRMVGLGRVPAPALSWPDEKPIPPLVPEMITSPFLFEHLAGALPRIALQCWTMAGEHGRTFLSCWHGLTLVQRIIDAVARQADLVPSPSPLVEAHQLFRLVAKDCLLQQIAEAGSVATASTASQGRPPSASRQTTKIFRWADIDRDLEFARDPKLFYPDVESRKGTFSWPEPPGSNGAPPFWPPPKDKQDELVHRINSWNELQQYRSRAWESTLDRFASQIADWACLWAEALDNRMIDPTPYTTGFLQVRRVIDRFMEDLEHEAEFAGTWSGAGDILQRWVLSFLNAVLIETITLKPDKFKSLGSSSIPERPALKRSGEERLPVRMRKPDGIGCYHALYQNLERLAQDDCHWTWSETFLMLASFPLLALFLPRGLPGWEKRKSVVAVPRSLDRWDGQAPATAERECSECICRVDQPVPRPWDDGPAPADDDARRVLEVQKLRESLDKKKEEFSVQGLGWIEKMGDAVLEPLPGLERCRPAFWHWGRCPFRDPSVWPVERGKGPTEVEAGKLQVKENLEKIEASNQQHFPLDLAGLSWCGLDLYRPSTLRPVPDTDPHSMYPLDDIQERRDALIAMLNSLVADIEPVEEVRPELADLAFAVHRVLRMEGANFPKWK